MPSVHRQVSERQVAANQANAQNCTGPQTPQGKARASLNALKHGAYARSNNPDEGKESLATARQSVGGGQESDPYGDPAAASGAPAAEKNENDETKPSDLLESR